MGNEDTGDLYIVEGLDGVGKSTTGQALADELDGEFYRTFDQEYNEFKQWVKDPENDHSWGTRLLFYLGGTSARADSIEETLEEGTDVVIDRYFPSVLSYHCAATEDEPEVVEEYAKDIRDPDVMVHLFVDEDERLSRLDERGEGGHDKERDTDFMAAVDEYYHQIGHEGDFDYIQREAVGGADSVARSIYDEVIDDE